LFYGDAGSDADQIKGDGALDNKGSTYITFSYNHFWDSGKASLLGLSEGGPAGLYITYHHNWFDHSDSRHPRVRYYSAHVYNNYYDGNSKYGVGSTENSSVFVEGNYFRNCKRPMLTSMQGTDVWSDAKQANDAANVGTFSGEAGGVIKAYNNTFDYTIPLRFVAYGDTNPLFNIAGKISSTVDFDAYVATTRGEQVPATVKSYLGANTYNNFDTDAALYVKNLVIDEPSVAKSKVMQYAGRVEGGDLKYTFNNAVDDNSYAVITALKNSLTNYNSALVSIQGETVVVVSSQTLTTGTDNNQTVAPDTAIEPMIFTWGGDATNATVTGLPASGINFVKDAIAKTITISGTPTANVTFSVTTSGSAGNPVTLSGSITVSNGTTPPAALIHNFTASGKTSTFYTITGNMNSTSGSVTYDGIALTSRLKIESSTSITFTTAQPGTLTLVLDATFNGAIKVDNVSYTAVAGIVNVPISAGAHTITKGDTSNLFYLKIVYSGTNGVKNPSVVTVKIYPNPVRNQLTVLAKSNITKVEIYTLTGLLVKSVENKTTINVAEISSGNYLVKVYTSEGVVNQKIVKE
jgi:pectate lyase